jgi:hypothetical protein
MKEKLIRAKIIALSQDALPIWKPKLLCLAEFLQPNLFVFGGTDISFTDEDLQDLYNAFPKTFFFVTNFLGSYPRSIILPLGNRTFQGKVEEKRNTICITYCLPDSLDREEFYAFLKDTPILAPLCVPKLPEKEFNSVLAQTYFSVCCCGNGFDTYRFWESLCNKSIPIVKKNHFFEKLRQQYPHLPFVCIDTWPDLLNLIPTLTPDYYETLWSTADISCAWAEYWESKLSELVNTP